LQVANCLFDDEYKITAVLDWTGCQTLPFESFAYPPMKIVPNSDEFLDWEFGMSLSVERRKKWNKNREHFLAVLETRELALETGAERTRPSIAAMIRSPRSHFAHILNWEGIVGMPSRLPEKEFLEWSGLSESDDFPTKLSGLE
jgi:hypothetical protein